MRLLLEHLTETWRGVGDVQFRIHARETRPQMLQVAAPNEIVILLGVRHPGRRARGMLNLLHPGDGHRGDRRELLAGLARAAGADAESARWLNENIGRIPMPVAGVIESSFLAGDLLQLQPGDVISLASAASSPLT